ncbi:MAG: DUF3945 domain-containing protein [Flavobacterium sp.]|nr:DUF3945 domain-containing protein [Flavobacterium sp.]
MEEKINDQQEVLLVKNGKGKKLEVVTGIDEKNGKLKTAPPEQENQNEFLKINKHENALENFFSNFLRQVKNPTQFRFFKLPLLKIKAVSQLEDLLNNPKRHDNAQEKINKLEINPKEHQKLVYVPIDVSQIDWEKLAKNGIDQKLLKDTNSLDRMLNWNKSPVLLPVNLNSNDIEVTIKARLSFREVEGKIVLNIHPLREKPNLDNQFYGINFTDQDKHNLLTTGNAGRIINIKSQNSEAPVYVSIDKLTNELLTLNANNFKVPNEIKGVKLNKGQQQLLKNGEPIYLKGMTNNKGEKFNSLVQISADKRGLSYRSKVSQQKNNETLNDNRTVNIPSQLLGVTLSEEQQNLLKEGKSTKVQGMRDQKSGKLFDSYVKVNPEKKKFDFSKNNPDLPVTQTTQNERVINQSTTRRNGPKM